MRSILSPLAESDLATIYDYIAVDNARAARRMLIRLRDQVKYIRQNPQIGPSRAHVRRGLRCLPVDHFIIYYTLQNDSVLVLRILYAAQDVEGKI